MNFFKCPSCGSTSSVKIDNKYSCKYCKTVGDIENRKEKKNNKYLYISITTIILLSSFSLYFFTEKSTTKKNIIHKEIFTSYSTHINSESEEDIRNLYPSTLSVEKREEREHFFTSFQSKKEYQSKFNNKYYDKIYKYPAYVELDRYGNRRVIEIPYEPKFYWNVTSGRLLKYFKKRHIQQTMNGKKLLTMSIIQKSGINLYTGTWISSEAFEREAKKLKKLGIYPPKVKFKN